jgi:hypothetical protein
MSTDTIELRYWKIVGAVIGAMVAVLTAFGIGFELGEKSRAQPPLPISHLCRGGVIIKLHAFEGPDDYVAMNLARLIRADGCEVDGPYRVPNHLIRNAQIRYFHLNDGPLATRIMELARDKDGVELYTRYLGELARKVPQGYVEVWLP